MFLSDYNVEQKIKTFDIFLKLKFKMKTKFFPQIDVFPIMREGEGEKYLNFLSSAINNSEQESVITQDPGQQLSSLELLKYTTSQQLQQLQHRPQKVKPVRLQSLC